MAFTGQLYQLSSSRPLNINAYVAVNGPWDTFGIVLTSTQKEDGTFLNLVRGCKKKDGVIPVASF